MFLRVKKNSVDNATLLINTTSVQAIEAYNEGAVQFILRDGRTYYAKGSLEQYAKLVGAKEPGDD